MAISEPYTCETIRVLRGLEGVRMRPGMYVGDVTAGGLDVCLWEVIGNAVEECIAGHGRQIDIVFDGPRATVEDDGRGIPIEALEAVLTKLHAGTSWRPSHVHLSPMLYGIGVCVANALASELEVTVWRDGHEYVQGYARGEPVGPIERVRATSRTGTRITLVPDVTIFGDRTWDPRVFAARCQILAALWPGLAITVDRATYCYDSLAEFLADIAGCELIDPLTVRAEHAGMVIQLGLAWTRRSGTAFEALVNGSPCAQGTHVEAVHAALFDVLGSRFGLRRATFRRRIARGMIGVLQVQLVDPHYGSPSRDWLRNPEVGEAVHRVTTAHLERHLANVPALLDALLLDLAPRVRVRTDGRGSEAPVRTRLRRRRSS